MNAEEWARVETVMTSLWRGKELSRAESEAYLAVLANYPAEQVEAVLVLMVKEGREWMPLAGEIYARLSELQLAAPTWPQARQVLVQALRKGESYRTFPDDGPVEGVLHRPRADYLAGQHELIQSFVTLIGENGLRYWDEEDTTAEAQMRTKWEQHVRVTLSRAAMMGVGPAGLRALEEAHAVGGEPEQIRETTRELLEVVKPA